MSKRNEDLVVKAKDCYDPADYVLVHKDRLRELLRLAGRQKPAAVQMSTTSFAHDGDGREVDAS